MARHDPCNRTRFWSDPDVPGMSLMCADFTTQEYAPHWHEALVIAATEAGGAQFSSRGTSEYAHPALLLVFNPAEPHSGRMGWSDHWRYRSFYLTRQALDLVARGLGIAATPHFTSNAIADPALVAAFTALHNAIEDGGDALAAREQLYRSFAALFARHGSGGGAIAATPVDRSVIAAIVDFMHAHHDQELSLDDMGRRFALTPFQLIRAFKKAVGLTPHAYLTQLRLNQACRLLRRATPIAEAAAAVGFYDQSALTRHFKRSYGITPLQYARAAQSAGQAERRAS
jgi:AraC-like DNA-binding protein